VVKASDAATAAEAESGTSMPEGVAPTATPHAGAKPRRQKAKFGPTDQPDLPKVEQGW